MMRSLWTAASGMIAQQTNVDNIANNISNVNTTGYKKQTTQFQSLLYSKLQTDTTDNNGDPKPVIAQVGSGVKVSGLVSRFTQGNMTETGNDTDMAISGDGFFVLQMPNGEYGYTRNGAFQFNIGTDGVTLSDASGYPVLDTNGETITLSSEWSVSKVTFDEAGNLCYPDETGNQALTGIQIGLVQFNNPSGLEKLSGSVLSESDNSGEPRWENTDTNLKKSSVVTGYLEVSNVQTVDEVVNLIVAQRAYEMNSKAIQASDEMLQQANNLRQ
jgi:flagellar basal-body rod protein FlgG